MKKKIILIGNTGMGNHVLVELLKMTNVEVCLVVTNKHNGHYPYYRIKELFRLSKEFNLETICNIDVNSISFIKKIDNINPDIILVSTFNQIFRKELLKRSSIFINLHPSLLPKYRGPSPVQWVLLNGEKETGVTAHFIDEGIDTGKIISQIRIQISENETINTLIKEIHKAAGLITKQIICQEDVEKSNNAKSTKEIGKYYKRPKGYDIINEEDSVKVKINKIRAFGFFPGVIINNCRYKIVRYYTSGNNIVVVTKENSRIII